MAKTLLCKTADIQPDGLKEVTIAGDQKLCVINAGGEFFACQQYCPHQGVPLCEGVVDGKTLTCLEHLWQWDLHSGESTGLAEESLKMTPVEVEGDSVYLKS